MILPQTVCIIMSIYVEGKGLFLSGNRLTVELSQLGSCLARLDISPAMNLGQSFIMLTLIICLNEGVISAIACYQKKSGIEWKDDWC